MILNIVSRMYVTTTLKIGIPRREKYIKMFFENKANKTNVCVSSN